MNRNKKPSWSFSSQWNKTLDDFNRRPPFKRDYLWASDLGKAYVDIWLQMNGVEKTNPFDSRAKRKFDAGVFWEWVVEAVAKRTGVFIDKQKVVSHRLKGNMKVKGYLDLLVGGKPDFEEADKIREALETVSLPDRFIEAMDKVQKKLGDRTHFPERVLEVKSSSAYMFDAQYKHGIPAENHALQLFHYLLGTGVKEGAVLYISKDDSRMIEIPIMRDDEELMAKYTKIVEDMTRYYENEEQPPKEKEVVFDWDKNRFSDNWNVKYSAYLTKLYGYKHESDYTDKWKSIIASWNRVVTRILKGKRMTDSNKKYIAEIKSFFPDFDEIVRKLKEKNIHDVEVEDYDDDCYKVMIEDEDDVS